MFQRAKNKGYSYVLLDADGVSDEFSFSFEGYGVGYLNVAHVHAWIDGQPVDIVIDRARPNVAKFPYVPEQGRKVLIRRVQPLDKLYSDFERGNVYNKEQVNGSFLNQLYIAHQFIDGFSDGGENDENGEMEARGDLNMLGFRIYNLAKNTNDSTEAVRQDKFFNLEDRVSGLENSLGDLTLTSIPWSAPLAKRGQTVFKSPYGVVNPVVWLNGVLQDPIKGDYLISTKESTITLSEPCDEGDRLFCMFGDPINSVRSYSTSGYARLWFPANGFRPSLTDGSTIVTHRPAGRIESPAHVFFSDKVRSCFIVAVTPTDMPVGGDGVETRFMVSGENAGNVRFRIETVVQGAGEFEASYKNPVEFTVGVKPQEVSHYRMNYTMPAADISQVVYLRVSRIPSSSEDTLAKNNEDAFFLGIAMDYAVA